MTKVEGYFVGMNNTHFVVEDPDDKCVLRLNSDFFIGVSEDDPSKFVVKNKEGQTLFKLSSNFSFGEDNSDPSKFIVTNSDGKKLLNLSPNFSIGENDNDPSKFVVKDKEGNKLLELSSNFSIGEDNNSPPNLVIKNANGEIVFKTEPPGSTTPSTKPFFNAYVSQTTSVSTGNGEFVKLIANTVISNIGNHYNPSTGIFTAPVTGKYQFEAKVTTNLNKGDLWDFILKLIAGSHTYTTHDYINMRITDPLPPNPQYSVSIIKTCVLNALEKASVSFEISNVLSHQWKVIGSESGISTYFTGNLLEKL